MFGLKPKFKNNPFKPKRVSTIKPSFVNPLRGKIVGDGSKLFRGEIEKELIHDVLRAHEGKYRNVLNRFEGKLIEPPVTKSSKQLIKDYYSGVVKEVYGDQYKKKHGKELTPKKLEKGFKKAYKLIGQEEIISAFEKDPTLYSEYKNKNIKLKSIDPTWETYPYSGAIKGLTFSSGVSMGKRVGISTIQAKKHNLKRTLKHELAHENQPIEMQHEQKIIEKQIGRKLEYEEKPTEIEARKAEDIPTEKDLAKLAGPKPEVLQSIYIEPQGDGGKFVQNIPIERAPYITVYHATNVENYPSIEKEGLLTAKELENKNIDVKLKGELPGRKKYTFFAPRKAIAGAWMNDPNRVPLEKVGLIKHKVSREEFEKGLQNVANLNKALAYKQEFNDYLLKMAEPDNPANKRIIKSIILPQHPPEIYPKEEFSKAYEIAIKGGLSSEKIDLIPHEKSRSKIYIEQRKRDIKLNLPEKYAKDKTFDIEIPEVLDPNYKPESIITGGHDWDLNADGEYKPDENPFTDYEEESEELRFR